MQKRGPRKGSKYIGTNKYPFGRELAKIRISKGYTQAELAKLSGISQRVISSLEREVQNPSSDTIKKVSEALKISPNRLLFPEEYAAKPGNNTETMDRSLYKRFKLAQKLPKSTKNELKKIIDVMINTHHINSEE